MGNVDPGGPVSLQSLTLMALFHCMVRYGSARLSSGRFAFNFPLQFSTAIEWAGLFTCCYSCAASTAVTSSYTHHKQTHTKERRRNSVLHSRHVDVFNSNGEVYEYENAFDLPPAAETVAVPRAVEEESRDVRAGVLRYLNNVT